MSSNVLGPSTRPALDVTAVTPDKRRWIGVMRLRTVLIGVPPGGYFPITGRDAGTMILATSTPAGAPFTLSLLDDSIVDLPVGTVVGFTRVADPVFIETPAQAAISTIGQDFTAPQLDGIGAVGYAQKIGPNLWNLYGGFVGLGTIQAVQPSSEFVTVILPGTLGMDSFGPPDPVRYFAEGKRFALRYLAYPPNGKIVTLTEVINLHSNGIAVLLNWENSAADPLGGGPIGAAHGAQAKQMALGLTYPQTLPIIASIDFGVSTQNMPIVNDYLRAFAAACAPYPLGVYGGTPVIDMVADISVLGWQAAAPAWSPYESGNVHIKQGFTIGDIDPDVAVRAFNAWLHQGNFVPPPGYPGGSGSGGIVLREQTVPVSTGDGRTIRLIPAAATSFASWMSMFGQAIPCTSGWRDAALQQAQYLADPHRFAPAATSFHTAGKAVDVDLTRMTSATQSWLRFAARSNGWLQARWAQGEAGCGHSNDEPWHFSWNGCG